MSALKPPISIKTDMRLFGKKKTPEKPRKKMDFTGYDLKLTIKAICMYERLSGKSFFDVIDEDMGLLLYCSFDVTNNMEVKYETFLNMLEIEDVTSWAVEKYKNLLEVIQQFRRKEEKEETPGEAGDIKDLTMTDMATSLIVDYHLDAHYVMYEMNLWEIEPMYQACDTMVKKRYEEERLWTYIDMLPHIDSNKLDGPQDLLPFPWEKDKKDKRKEELEKNSAAAFAFLGGNKNGERRDDPGTGQGILPEVPEHIEET
jgi:hypothetical protein